MVGIRFRVARIYRKKELGVKGFLGDFFSIYPPLIPMKTGIQVLEIINACNLLDAHLHGYNELRYSLLRERQSF